VYAKASTKTTKYQLNFRTTLARVTTIITETSRTLMKNSSTHNRISLALHPFRANQTPTYSSI
jgi:hypothetical protein